MLIDGNAYESVLGKGKYMPYSMVLSKKQCALAMNGKNRVRKKWVNVFYKKLNKVLRRAFMSGFKENTPRILLSHDETGGDAETAIAVMKCGGAI